MKMAATNQNQRAAVIPRKPERAGEERETGGDPLDYLSASRLKTFQECRLKFYFHYVERLPVRVSPALFIGKVTHGVLQQWNLKRWRALKADAAALEPVFLELWQKSQPEDLDWKGKEAEHREKTWIMVKYYLERSPVPLEEKPEAVEVLVKRDLDAHGLPPLKGVIDLVRKGGVIVDFKTTARTPDPVLVAHQHEVQLGCYALLYREATGHPEGGFELHHLVKTKEPKLVVTTMSPIGHIQMRRLVRAMESYVHGILSEDFVPSPGQHCAWCDYFSPCQAWRGGGAS